jgi:hypothetical protein
MLTDAPPRKANRAGFLESDRIKTLDLPQDGHLLTVAKSIESAMKDGTSMDVRRTCAEFLAASSRFYNVPDCGIRLLAARPLRVREHWTSELFGDYDSATMLVRVWMRNSPQRGHVFRHIPEHAVPRVLPPSRFPKIRIPGFMAHAGLLRASRCVVPPCTGDAAKATVLGGAAGRALADRLAEDESGHLSPQA